MTQNLKLRPYSGIKKRILLLLLALKACTISDNHVFPVNCIAFT